MGAVTDAPALDLPFWNPDLPLDERLDDLVGRLSIEESVPGVVNVILGKVGRPGLEYLDYRGRTVRW